MEERVRLRWRWVGLVVFVVLLPGVLRWTWRIWIAYNYCETLDWKTSIGRLHYPTCLIFGVWDLIDLLESFSTFLSWCPQSMLKQVLEIASSFLD